MEHMQGFGNGSWLAGVTLGVALMVAGCAAPSRPAAPVEDRGTMVGAAGASSASGTPMLTTDPYGRPLPGIENYGKPGYYTVRPGDTIRRIGVETGQTWQNLVRWNNLERPDIIEVGQVLRVIPPGANPVGTAAAGSSVDPATGVVTRPVAPQTAIVPGASASSAAAAVPPSRSAPAAGGDEEVGWIWPAQGALIAGFSEVKNKGLDIGGKAGDPVIAAADGRVVYAGAGLRGYGNLIILKHNNTYLTAYAHNQTLLVKEDQSVQKGQKIAEMGNSDADRVKLHFEIRKQGKPVDPARYLPAR
ncbi:peptidoglycan DD-metalloendopeptidase family protein [Pseudomonas sp.]|jgi:lipoprotein NlpD|uniref:peptidoglycan DD-metalloendopeptidase family protein n=1 Tax=Pseudomonas sp. TaxID=306 RepID=UPI0025E23D49|nr:peptidoglycan DD-metalloendopeptidase family protein [Pseudomonas sp.]